MLNKLKRFIRRIKKNFILAIKADESILESALYEVKLASNTNVEDKYNLSFNYIDNKAKHYGFVLYNKNLKWIDDENFLNLIKNSPDPYQRNDRKFVAWQLAKFTNNIEGHTAECGVLYGATSYLICKTYLDTKNKYHHVFDSFEGLSEPTKNDVPESERAFKWKEGDLAVSLKTVQKNLNQFSFIKYYKGWIPEKFYEVQDINFRFVHIDVDLYQPTKESLEFFYPRLTKGGIILCDDYGFHTCEGAFKAFNEFIEKFNIPNLIHLPTGQGLIIKN